MDLFFNFWPGMPDHLVGREHHEGSHLLHRELLVRQPGNGPCVGKVSTALWVHPPLSLWIYSHRKRASVHAMAIFMCVCENQMAVRALEAIQVIERQCAASRQSSSACCSALSTFTSPCFHHHFILRHAFKMALLMANKSPFMSLYINNKTLMSL